MKTPLTPGQIGPKYWRSLDELAGTAEFQQWVAREFPSGASELLDPVSRRKFVKLMSASFLLAGLGATGCRRPVEKIHPFARMPEDYVHGQAQYFATAMPARRGAIPLVVKSSDGRPTKIEGNSDHPDSNGSADAAAQAAVLSLYDPDRATRYARNGEICTRAAALDGLTALAATLGSGEGAAFLLEQSSSPSRARMQQAVGARFPKARWHVYEPVDLDMPRTAATMAYGKPVAPYYNLDKAQTILALDCDFIGSEQNATVNIARFAQGRGLASKEDAMSRLYAVESLYTLTGMNADHRLRVAPGMIVPVVARLALNIMGDKADGKLAALSRPAEAHDEWILPCVKDLKATGGKSLVMGGYRLPLPAHLLVLAMNEALGAKDQTIEFHAVPEAVEEDISALAKDLHAGKVQTLVILGGNPAYNAPADLGWASAQAKAKTVVRLGYHEDETSWNPSLQGVTQWDLPAAHFLESWGDARTANGTLSPIQPLIEPMFDGLTELEVLAILAGAEKTKPYDITRETFRAIGGPSENDWRKYLHDGYLAGSASEPASAQYKAELLPPILALVKEPASAPGPEKLEVVFHRDSKMDDGRHNNNGWLQELPDPVTKLTWDNAILVSPKTAREMGLAPREQKQDQTQRFYDQVVEIQLGPRTVRGAIWVQPGMADYTVGLALGYGRERTGRIGRNAGYNAGKIRTSEGMNYASGATLKKTGETFQLSTTQSHWNMEGRAPVREGNLEDFRKQPDFAGKMTLERPPVVAPLYPNPLDRMKTKALHQWGMAIDLNKCVGCSACMVACQSENNIPIVGKEMVGKSREMHWIRIDRYYAGIGPEPEAEPQAALQPMLCQHCEAAPCENVCPVNATSHDDEGLNVMTYNRCVGTRYCSNNCPYKVRRFNFFDYNRRPLDNLYQSPLDPRDRSGGKWELLRWWENPDRGNRPEDEWQMARLVHNPDVSVRMRGVMEKCTFCLQRIEQAKIAQKVKARASNHIRLSEKEGTIPKTACQQACPAQAIAFGDVSDPESTVSKWKAQPRNYTALDFLNTKPRLTYLAKIRNPNPEMPDYKRHQEPYSYDQFKETIGRAAIEEAEPAGKGAR
ncbi:MAG: TAT-variant-translocated molybdopterin oxidoreductase [Verrucomicrobiota bacterium]